MNEKERSNVESISVKKNSAKENHSWIAVAVWIVYGIYALFTKKIDGFISFILYFTIGLFIASFSSILTYLPMHFLDTLHDKYRLWWIGLVTLILTPVALIGTIIWIIFIANVFLKFTNNF